MDVELRVATYKFWREAESAWKSLENPKEILLSFVCTEEEEGEESLMILTVSEGRDLLQHLQVSPWAPPQPRLSLCRGWGTLLVQTLAPQGARFLLEVNDQEEQLCPLLELLAGPRVPRVTVTCLADWQEARLCRDLTPLRLASLGHLLEEADTEEVAAVRGEEQLMACVGRLVRRVAMETGLLCRESGPLLEQEEADSDAGASQDLLCGSQESA